MSFNFCLLKKVISTIFYSKKCLICLYFCHFHAIKLCSICEHIQPIISQRKNHIDIFLFKKKPAFQVPRFRSWRHQFADSECLEVHLHIMFQSYKLLRKNSELKKKTKHKTTIRRHRVNQRFYDKSKMA